MGEIQLFRVQGTTDLEKISCDHVDGQNVIFWSDIEQSFHGVKHIKNGEEIVKLMKDSDYNM